MFKRNAIAMAVGGVALFSGCATTAPSAGLNIEPVMAVRSGVDAERQYRIGRQWQGQMRYEAAEQAFLKALALDPGHAEAHNALGTVYFALGRIRQAEEQFKLAIIVAPTRAHLHNNLGYLYQEIGRLDEAVSSFSEAVRLDPHNPRILNNLAALTCQDKGECTPEAAIAGTPAAPAAVVAQPAVPQPAPAPTPAPLASITPTVQLAHVAPNVWELQPATAGAARQRAADAVTVAAIVPPQRGETPVQLARTAAGRFEVANGNGVTGLAKRVGGYLREQGYAAPRLTNHQTFSQKSTEIQYVAGAEALARQLGRSFAQPARLVQVARLERQAPVRLVLGKDFNEATAIAQGSKPAADLVALHQEQQN